MTPKSETAAPSRRRPHKGPRTSLASKDRQYLFVYGTLKRGARFHRRLGNDPAVQYIGEARIRGELFHLPSENFPGAIPGSGNRYVYGQLFSIKEPQKTLRALDEFEGVAEGLFRRKMVDAWAGKKRTRAWVYFYAGSLVSANQLADGVYS